MVVVTTQGKYGDNSFQQKKPKEEKKMSE